jgi:hypothetical protein
MTSTKKCPIAWTEKDGPYPCAFKANFRDCNYHENICISSNMCRYKHAISTCPSRCPECGTFTATGTFGDIERGWLPLCPECAKKHIEDQALAAHVMGCD